MLRALLASPRRNRKTLWGWDWQLHFCYISLGHLFYREKTHQHPILRILEGAVLRTVTVLFLLLLSTILGSLYNLSLRFIIHSPSLGLSTHYLDNEANVTSLNYQTVHLLLPSRSARWLLFHFLCLVKCYKCWTFLWSLIIVIYYIIT